MKEFIDNISLNLEGIGKIASQPDEMAGGWLVRNFNNARTLPFENEYITAIPGIFSTVEPRKSIRNIFRKMAGRNIAGLRPVVGYGATPEESKTNLTTKLLVQLSNGFIKEFCQKSGQDENVLLETESFEVITLEHPLHDHSSPRLYDFRALGLDKNADIRILDFEGFHYHVAPL